jgi:hypothetical protein
MFLDELRSVSEQVGVGTVGRLGQLGILGKPVRVMGTFYTHALGAHAPSSITFNLNGAYTDFQSSVGINDDAVWDDPLAQFKVYGDGRLIAEVDQVRAGCEPRELIVDVSGVKRLELVTVASGPRFLHTVWLEPLLSGYSPPAVIEPLEDVSAQIKKKLLESLLSGYYPTRITAPFGGISIQRPANSIKAVRCIATVASAGFASYLEGFLSTIYFYGCVPDAAVVVFNVNADPECAEVIRKYNAIQIDCAAAGPTYIIVKTALYTVGQIVDAEEFLCIDADTLVVGDLRPLFYAIRACPKDRIFICREMNDSLHNLGEAFINLYMGGESEWQRLGGTDQDAAYQLVVNTGVFAASKSALQAFENALRALPTYAVTWESELAHCRWREQFLANLALARLDCAVELDQAFNFQLIDYDVEVRADGQFRQAVSAGRRINVLHFNGLSRAKYHGLMNAFAVRFE